MAARTGAPTCTSTHTTRPYTRTRTRTRALAQRVVSGCVWCGGGGRQRVAGVAATQPTPTNRALSSHAAHAYRQC
eukprot:1440297-Prymnesium_polylepis.1